MVKIKTLFIHLVLFLAIFLVDQVVLILPLFVSSVLYFLAQKKYNFFLIAGVYSLCLGSEIYFYAYSLILVIHLILTKKTFQNIYVLKISRLLLLFIGYLFLSYIVQLFYNYSLLSFPLFFVTFLSPMGVLLFLGKLNKTNYSKEYIFQQILHIAIAQAIIALLLQAIPTGIGAILKRPTLGDVVVGTTGDPTDLSILMIFSVLPFLIDFKRGNLKIIIILVFFIVMMVLNDSKTHLYALLLVSICTWLINRFFINKSLITKSLFIVSAATLSVFALNYVSDFTQRVESKYGDYISGRYDAKSRYYQYTFSLDTRPFTQYVFGTGPGTNGTRAANALAYDVMYKKDNTVQLPGFIPPSSSRFTKDYISGLFTEEYAESSNFRSAVLGNPFNSICALFVEFGIVGFFLFFLFLFKCIKNSIQLKNNTLSKIILFSVLTNIVVSFLDQTFETPMPMHFMYFFIGLGLTEKHFSDAFSRL